MDVDDDVGIIDRDQVPGYPREESGRRADAADSMIALEGVHDIGSDVEELKAAGGGEAPGGEIVFAAIADKHVELAGRESTAGRRPGMPHGCEPASPTLH